MGKATLPVVARLVTGKQYVTITLQAVTILEPFHHLTIIIYCYTLQNVTFVHSIRLYTITGLDWTTGLLLELKV